MTVEIYSTEQAGRQLSCWEGKQEGVGVKKWQARVAAPAFNYIAKK
jgi:hypothetical protein